MQTEKIGEMIERIRKERGITQAELAEKSGIDKGTIWRIEGGLMPRIETLSKILAVLGYSFEVVEVPAEARP